MHISWLGQTCIKIQTKNQEQDVNIVIDAYKPQKGEFPRSFSPEIAVFSHGLEGASTLSQNPFVISTPGEFEIKNVLVHGIPEPDNNVIYKITAENLRVAHLGVLKKKLENGDLEKIGTVDIVLVPVGGGDYLDAKTAAEMVSALEPRIVIPIAYRCDTDSQSKPVEEFIKEIGLKPELTDKKIIIKQKDLPQEDMKLMILEK